MSKKKRRPVNHFQLDTSSPVNGLSPPSPWSWRFWDSPAGCRSTCQAQRGTPSLGLAGSRSVLRKEKKNVKLASACRCGGGCTKMKSVDQLLMMIKRWGDSRLGWCLTCWGRCAEHLLHRCSPHIPVQRDKRDKRDMNDNATEEEL